MENSKIIEINGIKMAIDERTARIQKVDTFKVGDPVKVLRQHYGDSFVSCFGVIVGFDMFKTKPTITVAYLDSSELKYLSIHEGVKHEMVAVEAHDLVMEKTWIIDRMKERIVRKEQEVAEEKSKFEMFVKTFGKYFEGGIPSAVNE